MRWIEQMMVHGEGDLLGQRVVLRDEQKLFLYRWQEIDPADGGWWYDEGYIEGPSGIGKTQEMAWMAAEAFAGPSSQAVPAAPNVIVQANSREQAGEKKGDDLAEGIFGRVAQVLTHENCPLRPHVRLMEDRIVFADGRPGRIRLIPAKGSTTDGGLPTLYIGDEVQDWSGQAADAYVRNSKSTTKTRMSRALTGSTPGAYAGQSSIGWMLHERGARGDDPRFLFRSHAAPAELDVKNPKAVRAALVACTPGIDKRRLDRLVRRALQIPRADFMRFHGGVWVEHDRESWLADFPGAWERCEAELAIPDGATVGVGVDVGLNRDSMSVVWCASVNGRRVVRCKVWEPEANRPVDIRLARRFILDELVGRYTIRSVAYDPRYFAESAAAIEDEGVPMLEMPQTPERMVPADAHLFDVILRVGVAHDGDHDLTQHVNAAVRRASDRGWYLSKSRSKRPMDACRALSLAVGAVDLWEPPESVVASVAGFALT